jgi:hypothetical protein
MTVDTTDELITTAQTSFVDVRGCRSYEGLRLIITCFLGVVATILCIALAETGLQAPAITLATLVVIGTVCFFVWDHKRWADYFDFTFHSSRKSDLEYLATSLFATREHLWRSPDQRLVKLLASTGRLGETIRVWRYRRPSTPKPLQVDFETRPLDEADTSFMELEAGVMSGPSAVSLDTPRAIRDESLRRQVRKRVFMFGNWWLFPLFLFNVVMLIVVSFTERKFQFGLLFQIPFLLALLFGPTYYRGLLKKSFQFFLLPGGLLMREVNAHSRDVKLHVFDRRQSALCLYEQSKYMWRWAIADQNRYCYFIASPREADLLLRAWLSPIPPPPVERLSDLT